MYYGFNGENWFDAADYTSNQWIVDAVKKEFTLRFRGDKDDFNSNDIQSLITLHQQFLMVGKELKVIYCANVKAGNVSSFENINTLLTAGVDIIAVEYGNETYSKEQTNFNFDTYRTWFEPLKALLDANLPSIRQLVFLAPRPNESGVLGGRGDHSAFNNAALDYIRRNAICYPTVHIYLNERECPVRATEIAKRVYTGALDQELADYYNTLYSQAVSQYMTLWDRTLDYINSETGKNVYITEWGFDNYGGIKNAMVPAMIAARIWATYGRDPRIIALLQHNGLSMASPGAIFPAHKDYDFADPNSTNLRRADYWVFKMFMETIGSNMLGGGLPVAGDNYIFISSKDTLPGFPVTPNGLTLVEGKFYYIGGDQPYTSAGATAWMKRGSIRSNELQVLENVDILNTYPFSVGYMKLTYDVVLPINEDPIADPGDYQEVYVGDTFILDGSSSYDIDGTIVKYTWYDELGAIISNSPVHTTSRQVAGYYLYYLEVEDDKGARNIASVPVDVITKPCTKPWWCIFVPRNKRCNC